MNKLIKRFGLLFLGVFIISGCGDQPPSQATAAPPNPSRLGDVWIKGVETKGVVLDADLMRRNIYLVFDCSGSMADAKNGEPKIVTAKRAIEAFGRKIPAETSLGLAIFDSNGPSERVPLGVNNRKQFYQTVQSAGAGGATPLSSAVRLGYEQLRKQAVRQLGYGEYHLVIVTDGEANAGFDPGNDVNIILRDSPVVIHTIGFHIGSRHSLNQPGRTVYKEANNPADLEKGLAEVLAESDKF
ncbi:MAG: vWA domain-containing protein [Candidatus Paceibacterota bacterium]|jgi:hypothetical protein